jgi:hypothetical protein
MNDPKGRKTTIRRYLLSMTFNAQLNKPRDTFLMVTLTVILLNVVAPFKPSNL